MKLRLLLFTILFLSAVLTAASQDIYQGLYAQRRVLLDNITAALNTGGKVSFSSGITGDDITSTKWSIQFVRNKAEEDSCICLCKWMYTLADNDTYLFYPEELLPKQITVSGETIFIPFINDDQPLPVHVANEAMRNKVIKWLQDLHMLCGG